MQRMLVDAICPSRVPGRENPLPAYSSQCRRADSQNALRLRHLTGNRRGAGNPAENDDSSPGAGSREGGKRFGIMSMPSRSRRFRSSSRLHRFSAGHHDCQMCPPGLPHRLRSCYRRKIFSLPLDASRGANYSRRYPECPPCHLALPLLLEDVFSYSRGDWQSHPAPSGPRI